MRLVPPDPSPVDVDGPSDEDVRDWAAGLATRLDCGVDGLLDVIELLVAAIEAGGGRQDDLVVRRARRLLAEPLEELGSVGGQLWKGPSEPAAVTHLADEQT